MRVTDIYINNYRAFYGSHHIELDRDGKNLMVYGENGSGKSSLFTALQSFFKSSVSKVDIEENIFIPVSEKNTASIKIKVREDKESTVSQEYEVHIKHGEIIGTDKSLIVNASKVNGFFDYRSLLETHLIHQASTDVNIFDLLVLKILPHAINRFSAKTIGEEWAKILEEMGYRKGSWRVQWLGEATGIFSKGLKYLLEQIQTDTNIFLKYFDKSLSVKVVFDECYYEGTDKEVYGNDALLEMSFAGQKIPKHHLFLNEARLSALAISLYLASIKANPLVGALKVLVLDDLLIGLDMGNRLPLLSILRDHFVNVHANDRFQIIMTTYDKVWFELVNNYFGAEQWKYIEIYSTKFKEGDFDFPIIKETNGYLEKAQFYLTQKDNKAAAVYIRTEFERVVKRICEKKSLQVIYKTRQKEFSTEDFWDAIKQQTNLDRDLIKRIEIHRGSVMNPFSHYDLESPEFERELQNTIVEVEKLGKINPKDDIKKYTFQNLVGEKEKLEKTLKYLYIGKIIGSLLAKK